MRFVICLMFLLIGTAAQAGTHAGTHACDKSCDTQCTCAPTATVIVIDQSVEETWLIPMIPVQPEIVPVIMQPAQIQIIRQPQILQTFKPEMTYTRIGLFGWRKGWRYQWAAGPKIVVR